MTELGSTGARPVAAIGVFPSRVLALLADAPTDGGSGQLRVRQLLAVPLADRRDTSLAIAEAIAGLDVSERLGVVARFDGAAVGPAEGSAQHAQRRASEELRAIRWASAGRSATLAPAGDVDAVVAVVAGAGHRVDHVDHLDAAIHEVSGGTNLRKALRDAAVFGELGSVTLTEMAALVGTARRTALVGTATASEVGNLLAGVGDTCLPAQGPAATGWAVAPMRAPVDFAAPEPDDATEFIATLAALSISLLAVVLALLVM